MYIHLIKRFHLNRNLKLFIRNESSQSVQSIDAASKFTQSDIKISTKLQTKLQSRKPLVKNFFLGIVDNELLAFPEVIPREDLTKLHNDIASVKYYFEQLDIKTNESSSSISAKIKDEIKELGLYGYNISQNFTGKGFFWSESLLASEFENKYPDLATILISHRLVVDVINNAGTDAQKQKYLSNLANGSIIATEALFENKPSENKYFNTAANFDDSTQQWTLNGEKSFVVNGNDANLFLVLAQTQKLSHSGEDTSGITMFLVDAGQSGVTVDETVQTFGCQGSEYCTIKFDKVKLSEENIIGKINEGNEIAQVLLTAQRIRQSLLGLSLSKNIINDVVQHSIVTKQAGIALKDMEMTTNRISKSVCKAFAMESMVYFTSGLMDEFQNQDVTLEAAITKLYCMENLWSIISSSIDFMGPKYLQSGESGDRSLRNAAHMFTQGESIESLRLYIALTGLQHAGLNIYETVTKSRNPLFNPGHIFSKFFEKSNIETPRPKLFLGENLHPSLEPAAQCLELSIVRLQMCTEILLTRYGNEIIEKHVDIKRLTEMITLIYAAFTSLARSSRSYCIGLHLADHELLTATSISLYARDRIKTIAIEIEKGSYLTNDRNLQRISKQILKSNGYFAVHPSTYNY